jgi:uncharacterized protein YkwD
MSPMGVRRFVTALSALSMLPVHAAVIQEAPKPRFDPIASTATEITRVVELVNEERQKFRLPALKLSEKLCVTARWHAMDMAVGGYFDHTDRQGRSVGQRLNGFGYRFTYCGQNIAAGQKTPEDAVKAWMNSPSHRENILRKEFREIGIGLVSNPNSQYKVYWVQDFGTP